MATVKKTKNILKFSHPASWWGSTWREALPTGNGIVGAAVYGGAANEVIMLNHRDLWWQGHVGVLQDVADKFKEVRKKMDDSAPVQAENILSNALMQKGYHPSRAYPLPLCDFKVKMPIDKSVREYSRSVNMENGEVGVTFRDGSTRYERTLFVSRGASAQDVLVYEITRVGSKAIDVTFSLDLHDRFNVRTRSAVSKLPDGVNVKYENYFMYFSARSDNGTEFGAVAFINHYGGSQSVDASGGITIKGAEKVLVLLKPYIESQREKEWKNIKTKLSSIKSTYEKLLKEHSPLHAKLFSTADIDLGGEQRDEFADVMLDEAFRSGEVGTTLMEKLWAYGRYLMITGSSPSALPLPPCGLWCGDYKAEDSAITAAGSLQTTYAHALSGGLADYLKSVFTYYETVLDDLKKNASRVYGCRGIMIPSEMAHGFGAFGNVEPGILHFTGVAGWICRLYYDYYLYTEDIKFLKEKALPFMHETAMFYEEFFKVKGDGLYESCPSYSPGTTPGNYVENSESRLDIARNATVDFAIAKDLLTNLIEGSEAAGLYKNELAKWRDMLTRIPSYKMNVDGSAKEYIDTKYSDNYASPSTAMFYPVYPATEIDEKNPEMCKAFLSSAKKKFTGATDGLDALAMTNYAAIFARFGDSDSAYDALSAMVRSMAMNNLIIAASDWRGMGVTGVDSWTSYSIVPNMGLTAALQEMIVQSGKNVIKLLPALPAKLEKGEVTGMETRVGVEIVSLSWDKKRGVMSAKVKAKKSRTIDVKLPAGIKRYKQIAGEKFDAEQGIITGLELPAGKQVSLDFKF